MIDLRHSMTALLARLNDIFSAGADLDERMADVFADWPLTEADLAPYVVTNASGYVRTRLYRDDRFEALVLSWAPGAASPIHDHHGQRCYLRVVSGELGIDDYALLAGGRSPGFARIESRGHRTLRAGDIDVRNPVDDLHAVAAPRGPAVSFHIYARPFDTCLVFDERAQTCRLVPISARE